MVFPVKSFVLAKFQQIEHSSVTVFQELNANTIYANRDDLGQILKTDIFFNVMVMRCHTQEALGTLFIIERIIHLNISYRVCFKIMSWFSVIAGRKMLAPVIIKDCKNSSCVHPLYKAQKEPSSDYTVFKFYAQPWLALCCNCVPSGFCFVLFYLFKNETLC